MEPGPPSSPTPIDPPSPVEPAPLAADPPERLESSVPSSLGLRVTVFTLSLAAVVISSLLISRSAGVALAGCAPGEACDQVLTSRWGKWLGVVPVSLLGATLYAALAALSLWISPAMKATQRVAAWFAIVMLSTVALLGGLWFTAIQLFTIGVLCPYCETVHAIGGVLALIVLIAAARASIKARATPFARPVAAGILLAATVPLGQVLVKPATHRVVHFQTIGIRWENYPILGDRDAKHVLVYFYDYTCPNCRKLHGYLREAQKRYPGQLAFALAPVPLSHECNPDYADTDAIHQHACDFAKLAMAVWRVNPDQLDAYDEYLQQGSRPPGLSDARKRAVELVGESNLAAALNDPWLSDFISGQISLNNLVRKKARETGVKIGDGVPTLIVSGVSMVAGRPGSLEEFYEILEHDLNVNKIP